jgi:hypothetical protein
MLELTKKEARDIVYEDAEGWKQVHLDIVETTRWSIGYSGVFKHKESDKFYKLNWYQGATECQDEKPFEYTEPDPVEVEPVEVTVVQYKPVEGEAKDEY